MSQPPPYNPAYQQQQQQYPQQPPNWQQQQQPPQQQYGFQQQPPPQNYGFQSQQQPVYMPAQQGFHQDAEAGQPKYDGVGFSSKSIRAGFIRKVFFLVTIMLLVVTGITAFFTFHQGAKHFVRYTTGGQILYWCSYGTFMVTYLTLMCCEGVRRKHPINLVLTAMLTLSIGYMTAMIAARYDTMIVVMTAGITCICCASIIVFASQTKYDFTGCMGIMFVISMVMMVFGFIAILVAIFAKSMIMYLIYAGIMSLVFMVYLAIDIQMIVGGKKHEISPEDHIYAAIQVFIDIIYIFWMLLQVIGGVSNNN